MKNSGLLLTFLIVGFFGILNGCSLDDIQGSGNVVSQERMASDFNGVTLEGVGNVNIYYAENFKVVVTTDSNIQDIVVINVNGNILYINEQSKKNFNVTELSIDVYMPEFKNIKLNGVGDITIFSGKTTDFEIILSGVGNIYAKNYEAENVSVSLSGTGNVET